MSNLSVKLKIKNGLAALETVNNAKNGQTINLNNGY